MMGQTIIEKILSSHSDHEFCCAGDIVQVRPDLVMGHDLTVPHAINIFRQIGIKNVVNPDRLMFVQDHFQPSKDIQSAGLARSMRKFALEQGIKKYYEVGWGGICHSLILEKGMARPGMLIAGADSHTLTCGALGAVGYGIGATDLAALWAIGELWLDVPRTRKITIEGSLPEYTGGKDVILKILDMLGQEGAMNEAIEYGGDGKKNLSIADRITIANMSAETGALTAIFYPDELVEKWLEGLTKEPSNPVYPDSDAEYIKVHEVNIDNLEPLVAIPHSPANVVAVTDLEDIEVGQVFMGSCANGSIEDIRRFAEIIGERKFSPRVRVLITPATQGAYVQALREGILEKIINAGGAVQTPSCGPCIGGHSGVLGAGDVCLSTTNRNFRGRMGHPDSMVYLAGPEVAAATAITGKISHPGNVGKE